MNVFHDIEALVRTTDTVDNAKSELHCPSRLLVEMENERPTFYAKAFPWQTDREDQYIRNDGFIINK
jgi:hypothetical protein